MYGVVGGADTNLSYTPVPGHAEREDGRHALPSAAAVAAAACNDLDGHARPPRPRAGNRPLATWRQAKAVELPVEGRTYDAIARRVVEAVQLRRFTVRDREFVTLSCPESRRVRRHARL